MEISLEMSRFQRLGRNLSGPIVSQKKCVLLTLHACHNALFSLLFKQFFSPLMKHRVSRVSYATNRSDKSKKYTQRHKFLVNGLISSSRINNVHELLDCGCFIIYK